MSLPATFWSKTRTTDCIIWTGACNTKGYPCFAIDGVSQLAHRVVWEDANGPIPEDMTIDHDCRVRNCVNVDHLELVTNAENNRRRRMAGGLVPGGVCIRDHVLTEGNIYRHPRGHIECMACRSRKPHRVAKDAA